ncbi:MAG: hypothetical protein QF368_08505 [SAR202 cluster bacterium]|nr:hypothetical protein [SAR202 cluster bacterium]
MKRVRNLKLIAAATALMVFFAAVSVAYAGLSWTGIDPEFDLLGEYTGTHVNVILQGRNSEECAFSSASVVISLPKNTGYTNLDVDNETCGNIDVEFKDGKRNEIKAKVKAKHSDKKMKLDVIMIASNGNGSVEKLCHGKSNKKLSCKLKLKKIR